VYMPVCVCASDACCQMGYGRRAVQLLQGYYEGKRHSLSEHNSHSAAMPSSSVSQVLQTVCTFLRCQYVICNLIAIKCNSLHYDTACTKLPATI